jgi:hypothetical protein
MNTPAGTRITIVALPADLQVLPHQAGASAARGGGCTWAPRSPPQGLADGVLLDTDRDNPLARSAGLSEESLLGAGARAAPRSRPCWIATVNRSKAMEADPHELPPQSPLEEMLAGGRVVSDNPYAGP